MKPLAVEHRKQLERVCADARDAAESGARAALKALAVHHREPYEHMSSEQCALRRRLRVHARQLGDRVDRRSGNHDIEHLMHECAYEHWHGMLFARFLAENHLLIEPGLGVAVTLEECEELAKEEGVDMWALAARFAHRMLPQVFRPDHPAFAVRFAQEHLLKLERLVESLPDEVFAATDSLGWVYQFWQSRKKDEVNHSEVKIGADELPAVTQLFTEPYMVSFLLDNALGAWWAARRLNDSDLKKSSSEAELRTKAAIPCVPLSYLRFVRCDGDDTGGKAGWRLASDAFEGWPEHLGKLKILDPCCGSGHFLVAAFSMLVPMRMAREGLSARDAVDAVLRENLHGLELDPRCVELAAFALAIAAWTYPSTGGFRPLPELNLACSGLSVGAAKESWTALAAGRHDLRIALDWMHGEFADAPVLGSLLNPAATDAAKVVDWRELSAALAQALAQERSDDRRETTIAAQRLVKAAELLAGHYHLVLTNVPYLTRGKQGDKLRAFCERHYPNAKNDLATVFLERCLDLCAEGGTTSLVLPQNWLFLTGYRKLREKLLKKEAWHLLARLGPKGFRTPMWDFNVQLLTLSHGNPANRPGSLLDVASTTDMMYGLDVSKFLTASEKAVRLPEAEINAVAQARQLENPDAAIQFETVEPWKRIGKYGFVRGGITSGDSPCFRKYFWEIDYSNNRWAFQQSTVSLVHEFGGRELVLFWENGKGVLTSRARGDGATIAGRDVWGKSGIAITYVGGLKATRYTGEIFENVICVLTPNESANLPEFWAFVSSPDFEHAVRKVNQKLSVDVRYFEKARFDFAHWQHIAAEKYPYGLAKPYSDAPTQWIFHGHPFGSVIWDDSEKWTAHGPLRTEDTVLQVAVARLLGYRWPAEEDMVMELADEQREWVRRCEALLPFADKDGIVCIPSVRGEPPAHDRLLQLLVAAFSHAWNNGVLTRLLTEAGSPNLDDWLRNRFFEQHCKLFHHRPFIWHVWDGRQRDGFHALVNYHKLTGAHGDGRRLLESLTHSYLGDWIRRQQDGVKRNEGGAEDRLEAALALQKRLSAILEGEPPFDLFVRWKPIKEQPIGWTPDVNDGVRLNIRPFMADDVPGGKKGAGILRAKPNIHWKKDRGKEPSRDQEQFPWFWRNGAFTSERVNDVHLTIAKKQDSRKRTEAHR